MKIAVNVKLQNIFRVICMEETDFENAELFILQVVKQYGIQSTDDIGMEFFNNKRAPIDFEILPVIVAQYKADPNFFIEIRMDEPRSFTRKAENLENFLRDHHCESILSEEKRLNRLSEDSLGYLLAHLCDYIYHEYSVNPTPNDIIEVSEATIEIFPSLSSKGENKITLLYDRDSRSGLLYQKLRYIVRKIKTKEIRKSLATFFNADDQKQIDELVKFFESCLLPDHKTELLKRMEASSELRLKSNGANRELFDKSFHLYRVDPGLVLEDFKFMFKTVNPTSLTTKWDQTEKKIQDVFGVVLDRKVDHFHRNEMVGGILRFLKLFPVHKLGFERAVDAFIVFSEDPKIDPQNLIKKNSNYPHIISIYSKSTQISRFYIVVSGSLMNVPNNYSFIQVMDIFCKIHFIFCVPFDAPLVQFMGVVQKYVYEMESDTKLTPTSTNKALQIFAETVGSINGCDLTNEV